MNAWFYFVMGFSVLWAWEQAPHFLRARRWRALVKKMVYEGVEMYFHSALLVVLYLFCVVPYLPEEQKHIYPFLFFAGA